MTPRRALGVLIAGSLALRLAWAAWLGLGPDEAYYALFARHLDWAYHDHPPLLAWVERLGQWLLGIFGNDTLALRAGFVGLFAGSTGLMARLTARRYGDRAGWIAAVILSATGYFAGAASTFALPDGPLLFFWLATLDRLLAALEKPGRLRPWFGVGLAWGGAMLSKYHAVFLPAGFFLFAAIDRRGRELLRTPGPYLAAALGLLLFSPVIVWNAAHGWQSFAFQAERAVGQTGFRPDLIAAFLGGQALYLFPWMWVFLIGAAVRRRGVIRAGHGHEAERLLLCQAAVPFAAFLAVACVRPVLPHWSLVAFLSLMPLLAADWAARQAREPKRMRRRLVVCASLPAVGLTLFAIQANRGVLPAVAAGPTPGMAGPLDPSAELWGWDQIATELARRGLLDRPGTFVFTSRWYESGQLAFALRGAVPVLCYNPTTAHGFAQWSRPSDWLGRNGILVLTHRSSTEPQMFDRYFARIEPLGEFDVLRADGPVRHVRLYECRNQIKSFPFDGR